jgi:hypothetical protein
MRENKSLLRGRWRKSWSQCRRRLTAWSCVQTTRTRVRALVDLQGLFTLQLSYLEAWTRKDRMATDDEVLITSASFIVMRSLLKTKSRRKRRWWMTSVFRRHDRWHEPVHCYAVVDVTILIISHYSSRFFNMFSFSACHATIIFTVYTWLCDTERRDILWKSDESWGEAQGREDCGETCWEQEKRTIGDIRTGPLVQEEKGCWSNNRRNIGARRRKLLQPEEGS